jgi:hypothetical protein
MAIGPCYAYKAHVDVDDIIEASELFMRASHMAPLQRILDYVVDLTGLDEDTAMDVLRDVVDVYDVVPNADADLSWEMQRLTAEAGAALGYVAVEMSDEQGTVYFVDGKRIALEFAGMTS